MVAAVKNRIRMCVSHKDFKFMFLQCFLFYWLSITISAPLVVCYWVPLRLRRKSSPEGS